MNITNTTCAWFAKCGQPATGTTPHPALGEVPTCDDCARFAAGGPRKQTRNNDVDPSALTFNAALDAFLQAIHELQAAHFAQHYSRLSPPAIDVDPKGKKYLRIVQRDTNGGGGQSVYCFVDKSNGDILKADGWKRPAKHARGSIFDNAGKGAITPWGCPLHQQRRTPMTCTKHPRYRAVRRPQSTCEPCWVLWFTHRFGPWSTLAIVSQHLRELGQVK